MFMTTALKGSKTVEPLYTIVGTIEIYVTIMHYILGSAIKRN